MYSWNIFLSLISQDHVMWSTGKSKGCRVIGRSSGISKFVWWLANCSCCRV